MNELLDQLHEDHKNFAKLLDFFSQQLSKIEQCEVVDFDEILLAMNYMKEYPDAIHHPLENTVFNYYVDHYQSDNDEIIHLLNEHESMPWLTTEIIDMLQCAVTETPISRQTLCESLSRYIEVQKQHMNLEEASVYPHINEDMTADDWENLSKDIERVKDPLFDKPVSERFSLLLKKIIQTAR